MDINIKEALENFLRERKEKFPNVTKEQKIFWVKSIEEHIKDMLGDNDIFFDFLPEEVEEINT